MTTNPYLENRNIWNNLLGGVALSNRVLRYSLFLMIATNTALAVDLIYESKRNETKPYLIVLNQDLNPLAMEYAEEYKSADTNVVRAFLARFVTDLRSISADMEVLNKQYQRLYSMLTSGSQAYNVISDNFKKDSPIVIAENETRSVEVKSVIKQSRNTREIEWREDSYTRKGEIVSRKKFRAILILDFIENINPKILINNPLGITVKQFEFNEKLI